MRLSPKLLAVAAPVMVAAAGTFALTGQATAQVDDEDEELLDQGEQLYAQSCASCHGTDGGGVEIVDGGAGGPSLQDAGEAGAYYYLSTGRMPLNSPSEQPRRKKPAFTDEEIDALVAYVTSLGDGPALPDVDTDDTDLANGGLLYRANCQACHSASGSGGALSYGRAAPDLADATPLQIGAAVRTGPGQMPVFGSDIVSDYDLDDLVSYVEYLDSPEDPGGLPIGRTGPIPEGFVAWLIGMVALIGLVMWIGTRNPIPKRPEPAPAPAPEEEP
jgi:ubiquinol-cytochrome c reductase cytochrome c subunit